MPIYEYRCEPCRHTFETLIRSNGDTAHCPQCGGIELVKQFSVPAMVHSGKASSALPICETGAKNFGCGGGHCASGMCDLD
jgi:putative FmdB family regulatory protein